LRLAPANRPRQAARRICGTSQHFGVESLALLANRVSIFVRLLEAEALPKSAAGSDKDSERNISPEGFFEK